MNNILTENEKTANKLVAKVMRITFIIFSMIYILNVAGIFTVEKKVMTIAYIGGSILLLLPTVLINFLKKDNTYIKYINVVCAAVFVTLLSITLTFHVVAFYVYPIAIASLYFSKQLNVAATVFTVTGTSAGQIVAFFLKTTIDDNFETLKKAVIFGVIPRMLVIIAVASIFTILCKRTANLLSNLMGAEEQKLMYEKMQKMQASAYETSEKMVDMVRELSEITELSLKINKRIETEADNLKISSSENSREVNGVKIRIGDITADLTELSEMNHKTALLTDDIGKNTRENQKRTEEATLAMKEIYFSTGECKKIISLLGVKSKEILGIIKTVTDISGQTNILALNASIEAARAGEYGKGFSVIAEEIQKLAEETRLAVESIGKIVSEFVSNTESAVTAMEKNEVFTQKGNESIKKVNETSTLITSFNEELTEKIHNIDNTAKLIKKRSDEIAVSIGQVNTNTCKNCDVAENVSNDTKESAMETEKLFDIVGRIEDTSKLLNRVMGE